MKDIEEKKMARFKTFEGKLVEKMDNKLSASVTVENGTATKLVVDFGVNKSDCLYLDFEPMITKAVDYSSTIKGNSLIAKYVYENEDKVELTTLEGDFLGCIFHYNNPDGEFSMSQLYRDLYTGDNREINIVIKNDKNGERTKGNIVTFLPENKTCYCHNDHKLYMFRFTYDKLAIQFER